MSSLSSSPSSFDPSPWSPPAGPLASGIEPLPPFVLLDDATAAPGEPASRLYTDFVRQNDVAAGDLDTLTRCLQQGWDAGWHVCVFIPYEFGAPLVGTPVAGAVHHPPDRTLPFHGGAARLLWFRSLTRLDAGGVKQWLESQCLQPAQPTGILHLTSDTGAPAFADAVGRIHQWIRAGHTYQVNYTQRLRFDVFGDPLALYARLRAAQPVPYGAVARMPDDSWVLSLSPELFVRHEGAGTLVARPMKGTAPLTGDAQADAAAAAALAADPKNRAENVMIVDLLRNDLGRVAVPGTVKVPALFEVRPFGAVLQMTSTVTAQATAATTTGSLLDALFPCGSITGAPKRRTMEIIAELESSPRGLYTGSIGWMDAPAPGERLGRGALSVAIRTLVLGPLTDRGLRAGEMGVGSGIVHDSVAAQEFAECGWKARFLTEHDPGVSLIETLRVESGQCLRLEAHLARLAASAAALGFPVDIDAARARLQQAARACREGGARLRLTLDKSGTLGITGAALAALPTGPVGVTLATETLPPADPLRRHKTTHRAAYDRGWQAAERAGAFDSLFFNTRGELLEGGRSSVFARVDGHWLTPPLDADILPGVMRGEVLRDPLHWLGGPVREATITVPMLRRADRLVLANSLRGVLHARLLAD
ncbi:chorismate-binding protein [Cupriavidus sp. AU9028]|uniref:chorismate-binding protein n=1 Tax=Cupriavidus sp. AU9028 TaxID=2871157 RepID=UPI001C98890B|nr:chorismate-binding protein [Cupriavidus sp. AU9028]MBY4897313.1 chorismate-binding protein [Cupriavidus sp. AU9028]